MLRQVVGHGVVHEVDIDVRALLGQMGAVAVEELVAPRARTEPIDEVHVAVAFGGACQHVVRGGYPVLGAAGVHEPELLVGSHVGDDLVQLTIGGRAVRAQRQHDDAAYESYTSCPT